MAIHASRFLGLGLSLREAPVAIGMAAAAFLVLVAVGTVLGMVAFTALLGRPLACALSSPAIERLARIGAGARSVLVGFAIGLDHVMGR